MDLKRFNLSGLSPQAPTKIAPDPGSAKPPQSGSARKAGRRPEQVTITPEALEGREWLAKIVEPDWAVAAYESRIARRGADGKWLPGLSPNPGGRPAGVLKLLDALTGDGEEMLVHALRVMRSEVTHTELDKDGCAHEVGPSFKDQAEARGFLAKLKWGRDLTGDDDDKRTEIGTLNINVYSTDDLRQFFALARRSAPSAAVVDSTAIPSGSDPERIGIREGATSEGISSADVG